MANQEHLTILKQGAQAWNQWRQDKTAIKPDLSHANLNGADLNRTKLFEANLLGANLQSASLVRTNLRGATLNGANLREVDLEGAYLYNADLSETDMSYAVLNGADLRYANIRHAVLHGASLRGADIRDTNLLGTDFSAANLLGASFIRANLSSTNLSGTNLRRVNLSLANLSLADLRGSDLAEAVVDLTIFAGNDLSSTNELEKVKHRGPSSIGIDTIHKSRGNIPVIFLRRCGLRDWEIEAAKLYRDGLTSSQITDILYKVSELRSDPTLLFHFCFISYSHEDKSFAHRLHDQLQARGIRCWLDEHQLLPGHDIYDEVDRGIRLWDKVLLCCSKNSLSSWWVDKEISTAFDKEQLLWKERGKKTLALIPLNLDGYLLNGLWQSGKAHPIKDRLAADFTGWESDNMKFERGFERLVKALRTDGGDREAPPPSKL